MMPNQVGEIWSIYLSDLDLLACAFYPRFQNDLLRDKDIFRSNFILLNEPVVDIDAVLEQRTN